MTDTARGTLHDTMDKLKKKSQRSLTHQKQMLDQSDTYRRIYPVQSDVSKLEPAPVETLKEEPAQFGTLKKEPAQSVT